MAFVKRSLIEGEAVRYRARFNWTYDVASSFWFLFGLAPTALRALEAAGALPTVAPFGTSFNAFAIAAGVLGALVCLVRFVDRWTTIVAVTDTRLILKRGLASRASVELALDKIEGVVVHQTLFGRVLGYGRLTVRGTGDTEVRFPDLADPIGFRRQLEDAITDARRAG